MKIYELLSDKSKFTIIELARDDNDEPISPSDPKACKWCVLGAFFKCYLGTPEYEGTFNKLNEHVKRTFQFNSISIWSDTTEYEKIIEVLKELDI